MVIETKRGEEPELILNKLYKYTELQNTFGIIMLALVDNIPKVLTLKEILDHYINHRFDVITRRTKFELEKAENLFTNLKANDSFSEQIELRDTKDDYKASEETQKKAQKEKKFKVSRGESKHQNASNRHSKSFEE